MPPHGASDRDSARDVATLSQNTYVVLPPTPARLLCIVIDTYSVRTALLAAVERKASQPHNPLTLFLSDLQDLPNHYVF